MKRIVSLLLMIIFLAAVAQAKSPVPSVAQRPDWGRFFLDAGVKGTIVLMKDGSGKAQVYDAARAAAPFLPASTFKVLNACIALETGVAAGPEAVFPWDGVQYPVAAWNKDLTFREAFAVSCVPVFQRMAHQVGPERMRKWVTAAGYGNADIGGGIDTFWLEGDLRISALQQVEFLKRLAHDRLPFSRKTMETVRDIMVAEKGDGWTIRAKTGWATRVKPGVGWWVGWLERGGEKWYFALNIDMDAMDQAKARQDVVRAVLKAEGLLP